LPARRDSEELELEDGRSLRAIDDVGSLESLRFLGVSECGDIESFAPIGGLERLEVLYAFGSTRVVDRDLSPLARLPPEGDPNQGPL